MFSIYIYIHIHTSITYINQQNIYIWTYTCIHVDIVIFAGRDRSVDAEAPELLDWDRLLADSSWLHLTGSWAGGQSYSNFRALLLCSNWRWTQEATLVGITP